MSGVQPVNLGWAIVAFGLMIFAHELGHFLIARRTGVTVLAFALGFGPPLVRIRRGETVYAVNVLPLGGYVRLAGEDAEGASGSGSLRSKSVWQRMAVVLAGPVMNLVLAVLLFAGLAAALGVPVGISTRIGQVLTVCSDDGRRVTCPAAAVGLRAGDRIAAIDGQPMADGEQVIETIHRRPHERLRLTVERDGRRFEVEVTTIRDQRQGIGLIGFRPESVRQPMGPGRALWWGVTTTGQYAAAIGGAVAALVRRGTFFRELSGPVDAVRFLGEAAQVGAEPFVYTAALLSIMVGLFNLLPVPALDGGRLLFLVVEAIRRRPVDSRREGYIHLVGFALLMLLLVVLTVRDLGRL
ncbi:MAG: M50 family metallopeptidase [Armatimonadota bacterium]|nr:M50 family metallopeptidase [Armatimonadota bacterium]MDR7404031.1 M50 family metallopeptidase [Armatimonadota bacterium]